MLYLRVLAAATLPGECGRREELNLVLHRNNCRCYCSFLVDVMLEGVLQVVVGGGYSCAGVW